MKFLSKAMLCATTVLGFGLALVDTASGAVVSCSGPFTSDGTALISQSGVSGQKTAALACQYLSPPSSKTVANEANVNDADFFGFSTWTVFNAISQVDPSNDQSGTVDLTGADFAANDYMIVFKDGQDTNLVAFLLNETTQLIDWQSPFREPTFDLSPDSTIKDVSHYTVFQRANQVSCPTSDPNCVPGPGGGPNPNAEVPAPATLALLGAGLVALGAARRRKA